MPGLYAEIDVLWCSRSEAAPSVVLEAIASGVPVVVPDIGDIKDMVGSFGLVTERTNEALVEALLSCARQYGPAWPTGGKRYIEANLASPDSLVRWTRQYSIALSRLREISMPLLD